MKKACLFIITCFIVSSINAQQSIPFKIKYLPNHVYTSTVSADMDITMNFTGSKTEIDKMTASGMKLPMDVKSNSQTMMIIKTGAETNGTIPLIMNIDSLQQKMTISGKEYPVPASPLHGQKIYGKYSTDGKMQLDSISGTKMDEKMKRMLEPMIKGFQYQIKFPDKPLKIGETFTQDIPFNLPVAGNSMQMNVISVYKLTAIAGNKAFFDVDQKMNINFTMKKDMVNIIMKGTGTGNGTMIFDIAQGFPENVKTDLVISYNAAGKDMVMTATMRSKSGYVTSIVEDK